MRFTRRSITTAAAIGLLAACSANDTVSPDALQLLAVSPAAAATGVSTSSSIVLTFSHAMIAGMESRVLVHEGTVTGPVVAGVATWSTDRTTLTFAPSAPLKPHTTYVIHLAGDMRGINGAALDHGSCASRGAQTVTRGMMGGQPGGMMGAGWQSGNGTYGMIFTFTTS